MGNARARGSYDERKRQAQENPRARGAAAMPSPRAPLALYRHTTIMRDGKKEPVIERHKDGERMTSADGRTRYVMSRTGLRRVD